MLHRPVTTYTLLGVICRTPTLEDPKAVKQDSATMTPIEAIGGVLFEGDGRLLPGPVPQAASHNWANDIQFMGEFGRAFDDEDKLESLLQLLYLECWRDDPDSSEEEFCPHRVSKYKLSYASSRRGYIGTPHFAIKLDMRASVWEVFLGMVSKTAYEASRPNTNVSYTVSSFPLHSRIQRCSTIS
jgi:hypothetical protein